jgi:uncharacterized protein (DUF1778 family)
MPIYKGNYLMNASVEARINIKTTQDIKNTLSRAAALFHQSLSGFLLEAAYDKLVQCGT